MQSPVLFVFFALATYLNSDAAVISTTTTESSTKGIENENDTSNDTLGVPQDLYIIKTIVYEVGILTDAGNDTDDNNTLNESHEQVDVSFYDPAFNGSVIDLSEIPVPIQTNVSGVTVTGLLPAATLDSYLHAAAEAANSTNSTATPVLPKKQITVTQNISTNNPDRGSEIISNLPKLLGLTGKNSSERDSEDKDSEEKKS